MYVYIYIYIVGVCHSLEILSLLLVRNQIIDLTGGC